MKHREERLSDIRSMVHANRAVPITAIASRLGVSTMTVRRDFVVLEKEGNIKNANGVLMSCDQTLAQMITHHYDYHSASTIRLDTKQRIGAFAATLITPNDCIAFDTGTTTECISSQLPDNISMQAFCTNLNILNHLCKYQHVEVAMAGGYYYPTTQMFHCPESLRFIRSIRINKFFLSAAGVHETLGISCANSHEVATKQALMDSTQEHILVADSSKFGMVRSSYVCDLSEIHTIITDDQLSQPWIDRILAENITLHLV